MVCLSVSVLAPGPKKSGQWGAALGMDSVYWLLWGVLGIEPRAWFLRGQEPLRLLALSGIFQVGFPPPLHTHTLIYLPTPHPFKEICYCPLGSLNLDSFSGNKFVLAPSLHCGWAHLLPMLRPTLSSKFFLAYVFPMWEKGREKAGRTLYSIKAISASYPGLIPKTSSSIFLDIIHTNTTYRG